MPNQNSEAFELSIRQLIKQDYLRAKTAYEYFTNSQILFKDQLLNLYLDKLADVQLRLLTDLSDIYFDAYGVYPQNDKQ